MNIIPYLFDGMGSQYRDQKFIENICRKIIEIRKRKGIVQEDLVDRTGFNLKQIGNIERGVSNTSVSNIAAIARALEIHPRELLDFDFEIPKNIPIRKERKSK
ncbi:helix-turn-helix domain-containing protein [Mucilaginibacter sp. E4BP6]|uniref:helix-turn-helix domain-containing protein n=1 Tax=Mucilaginibacter sp. E4BP6 TaxID=2723089 RepID=UPI00180C74F3|nr:helix-turn-helix transcriptional regulator [Mucilaginibacter sp. E4BP6]NYE64930.1 transcriptional regulator with XRE-family HTH domain [Mucilaginibacter sp. E4BP6]